MGDGTLASPFGRQLLLFAVKRLLTLIPLLIGVSLLVFSMLQLVPGDPVRAILGESTAANPEQVERIRQELGLDKPLHVQYLTYVGNVVRGDFGTSIRTRKPVLEQIMLRLPSTLELTLAGLGFAIVFGTGLSQHSTTTQSSTNLPCSLPFWECLSQVFG